MGLYLAELLGHRVCICAVLVDTDPKVSQYGYTNSHSHQQCLRVLIAPQPGQHLVLSVLLILRVLMDFIILHGILEIGPFPQLQNLKLTFNRFILRNAECTKAGDYIRCKGPFTVVVHRRKVINDSCFHHHHHHHRH